MHLSNNQIIIVCFCDLYRLEHLEILDLSHQGGQRDLQQDVKFSPKPMIQTEHTIVNTTSNRAEANSCFNSKDCSVCQKIPMSLITIKISHSKLLCELVTVFVILPVCLNIWIYHIRVSVQIPLKYLENDQNISKLKYLNVASSSLKSILNTAFSLLGFLRNLALQYTYIGIADFDLQTQYLEYLDLSYNNILYLSKHLTETSDSIARHSQLVIKLKGNQLICDCERLYFVSWLRYSKAIYLKDKLTCNLSKSNTTYSISKIAELHHKLIYECSAQDELKGCIVGFLVLNSVLGLLSQLWYRRWKLRYLLAVGRRTVTPYHPIEEMEIELEYDVYISYERDFDLTKLYSEFQRRGLKVLMNSSQM